MTPEELRELTGVACANPFATRGTRIRGGVARRLLAMFLLALTARAEGELRGFEMPMTLSGAAFASHRLSARPGTDSNTAAAFRVLAYPTLRISERWFFSGAIQVHSRPYLYEEFSLQGTGFEVDTLQAYVGYERFKGSKYVSVRAGQLASAFGSFSLSYDDAVNPLIDLPIGYGYYYTSPVTTLGMSGVQVDVGGGKVDARAQFTSSSPTNRRGISDDGQYGSWTGGVGFTPVQGLRVGASAYRGPYLDDNHPFNFPGEIHSRLLPASGLGLDVQFARGHWYVKGELNRFLKAYTVFPTLRQSMGWGELKYVLSPRWYLAGRANYHRSNLIPGGEAYEFAVGYRQSRRNLVKVGYQIARGPRTRGSLDNVLAIQFVMKLKGVSKTF